MQTLSGKEQSPVVSNISESLIDHDYRDTGYQPGDDQRSCVDYYLNAWI